MATHLLLYLELVNNRSQLRQDLVCLLVILELCGNKICKVAKRLGSVKHLQSIITLMFVQCSVLGYGGLATYILHHPNRLFCLTYKLILSLLNLGPLFFGQVLLHVAVLGRLAG